MPRAPSEKMVEAEKLFKEGMALVEIAKKLGVSDGTVRSWKNRGKWGVKTSKKNECNVAKKSKEKNATLQKKRGAPKGNKNAKGNKGNPNPVPPIKHGGYSAIYWDTLDDEEKELIESMQEDTELMLIEQIKLFTIRERRLMKAINKYTDAKGGIYIQMSSTTKTKREFKDDEEKAKYEERIREKVESGDRLPGESYNVYTQTSSTIDLVARLNRELSDVQAKKTKAISELNRWRLENKKLDGNTRGNDAVDDWISAVLGTGGDDNG